MGTREREREGRKSVGGKITTTEWRSTRLEVKTLRRGLLHLALGADSGEWDTEFRHELFDAVILLAERIRAACLKGSFGKIGAGPPPRQLGWQIPRRFVLARCGARAGSISPWGRRRMKIWGGVCGCGNHGDRLVVVGMLPGGCDARVGV